MNAVICTLLLQANSLNFAQKKKHLKENLTVKSRQKEEASTLRLRKKEQHDTAVMVQKHSEQMLNLLKEKQQEIRQEIVDEMVRFQRVHIANADPTSASTFHLNGG